MRPEFEFSMYMRHSGKDDFLLRTLRNYLGDASREADLEPYVIYDE